MKYVDAIVRGEPPENPTRIMQASIGADNVPPPNFEALTEAKSLDVPDDIPTLPLN